MILKGLSAARLILGYFSIGTLFQNLVVPSLKAGLSLSSSQRSIISNSNPASCETRGAFKPSVSKLNGSTRNVICGLFIFKSRNRETKLSFRVSRSVAYLAFCLFRVVIVICSLAFSRVGKCVKSPLSIRSLNSFSLLARQTHFAQGQAAISTYPANSGSICSSDTVCRPKKLDP